MKRFIELLKKLIYVIVTIVLLLGVNQALMFLGQVSWLDKQEIFINWWSDIWKVEAQENSGDWEEREIYIKVIDDYLESHNSPMTGSGEDFVLSAQKYNLPRYLMVAMAGTESNFGLNGYANTGSFNAVGLGVYEGRSYRNWEEGIDDMAYVLRNYYFDEGKDSTVEIQNKWAPRCADTNSCDNSWADSVDYFINDLNNLEKEYKGEI